LRIVRNLEGVQDRGEHGFSARHTTSEELIWPAERPILVDAPCEAADCTARPAARSGRRRSCSCRRAASNALPRRAPALNAWAWDRERLAELALGEHLQRGTGLAGCRGRLGLHQLEAVTSGGRPSKRLSSSAMFTGWVVRAETARNGIGLLHVGARAAFGMRMWIGIWAALEVGPALCARPRARAPSGPCRRSFPVPEPSPRPMRLCALLRLPGGRGQAVQAHTLLLLLSRLRGSLALRDPRPGWRTA